MAEVLFITPNVQSRNREASIGTLLLATILKNSGISVEIQQFVQYGDLADFDAFIDTAVEEVRRVEPKIVSFYSRCDTYHISLMVAKAVKERIKDVWVVFGGPQADISSFDTVTEIPWVDFVCCGEGETTVVPFFNSLLNGTPDLATPGLVYRTDSGVCRNPKPELLKDLDSVPEVDYSLLDEDVSRLNEVMTEGHFSVDVGRGCPFGCTYCSTKTFWGRKYRLKSPERIVQEICSAHERFGASRFTFEHDMFTMKKDQVLRTCELIKQLDFPVIWKCCARVDCIDKQMIDTMAEAGMEKIFVGIETGSPRMQKLINKNLKLDGVQEMLEYISSKGVMVTASFIYGFPEETEEDIEQTLEMIAGIAKIPNSNVQTHLCTFLPGTELSTRYMSEMTPAENFSNIVGMYALKECWPLIEAHPALFTQFMEYKTPLRKKLEHFETFARMWCVAQPVYTHISKKYPKDHLMDMYYDFVDANREMLSANILTPMDEIIRLLVQRDRFVERFSDDDCYDIMNDFYRFRRMQKEEAFERGETVMDVCCFSPLELKNVEDLHDCPRGVYIVAVTKNDSDGVNVKVRKKTK